MDDASDSRSGRSVASQSGRERRISARTSIDLPVCVTRATGELLACHAVDVSSEGMRLKSAHAFAPGALLRLRLTIPGKVELILRGRVCYQVLEAESILTGVRFEQMTPRILELLNQSIDE